MSTECPWLRRAGEGATDRETAAGAACTVAVQYQSDLSSAAGLGPMDASVSGPVSWSWTVNTRTTPGT